MSAYLNGNPIKWLMEDCGMEIRHLCARDILRPLLGESAVADEYERLRASHEYRHFFSLARDGVLGDRRGFDLVGRGAMWRFAEAVARGYDRRELAVRETAGFLIGRCRGGSGGFVMNWTPAVEAACVTGAMVRRLIEAGFDDDSIGRGIAWITSHQRHDGGWLHCPIAGTADVFRLLLLRRAGSGLSREEDRMVGSCVFASFECLMALLEYEERRGVAAEASGRAIEFFLENRMFMGPFRGAGAACVAGGRRSGFSRYGYPVFLQYDTISGLIAIARSGRLADWRANGAFNAMLAAQNADGSFPAMGRSRGMPGRGGRLARDPWVTLNALRILTRAGLVRPEELV
ncbi:MAG TPA: hypothetical protein PK875_04660 [Spirochaetota bacterium]|nr:MAG: hypothetical protein BWY96_00386 [Spirochaetes bacterium ADurb.BinA120]HPI13152.1 hypothetical protein [Spirochaetota bacterium]HPO45066.1 hypothetical protein [Spirochaetota bacterium]